MRILKNTPIREISIRCLAATAVLGIGIFPVSAQTDTTWVGGNGSGLDWGAGANWSGNHVPDSATYGALFKSGTTASLNVPIGSASNGMTLNGNTDITLNLSASPTPPAVSLSLSTVLNVGSTGGGGAHLSITGAGTMNMLHFVVGNGAGASDGNSLRFSGGSVVNSGGTGQSRIGRFANENQLIVEQGASLTIGIIQVGYAGDGVGTKNNKVVVTGSNSSLTINGTSSNRGFRIGSLGTNAVDYGSGMSGNSAAVQEGGKMTVSGAGNFISLGNTNCAHSNYLLVEGDDGAGHASTLELSGLGGTAITIGDAAAANLGGNYLEVRNGGRLISLGTETFAVNGHASGGTNDGDNRLTVGPDGGVDMGGNLNISGGLLQLDAAGSLQAGTVTISGGGRFEAAGSGLGTTGANATRIRAASTLAVGLPTATTADVLELGSKVSLEGDSVLELKIFSGSSMGQIKLDTGGSLAIDSDAVFKLVLDGQYVASYGDSWNVFSGQTGNITGAFTPLLASLPSLPGGLDWDLDDFNAGGGWSVSVVPEPGSVAFILLASAALFWKRRATAAALPS